MCINNGIVLGISASCQYLSSLLRNTSWGFPGGAVIKNLPANAGDMGSSPGPGRSYMPWSS